MTTHRAAAGEVVGKASAAMQGVTGEMHLALVARRGVTEGRVRGWIRRLRGAADQLEEWIDGPKT